MKAIRLIAFACMVSPVMAGMIREATSDPRISSISYNEYAGLGEGSFQGPVVPKGKIWYIQTAGIGTTTSITSSNYLEWMMQVATVNPGGKAGVWLFPLEVNVGWKGGTPVLAITRPVILRAGQCLYPRVDSMPPDKTMILLFDGWEISSDCLPQLLGIGGVASATSSVDREILSLESQLSELQSK